jgi:hypothetical protein
MKSVLVVTGESDNDNRLVSVQNSRCTIDCRLRPLAEPGGSQWKD